MSNLTCPTCATEYVRKHGRQKYCTAECRPADKKLQGICAACGKHVERTYSGTPRIHGFTCSPECHYQVTWGDRCILPTTHPARTKKSKVYDMRSPLRKAVEEGAHAQVIEAIRLRTDVDMRTGCWIWQGQSKGGYPLARLGKKDVGAHRLSLEAKLGMSLGDQPAHHVCAVTMCVNPDHLQPVTHRENTAEMLARTYMERRIIALEVALRSLAPDHSLLAEVGLPAA